MIRFFVQIFNSIEPNRARFSYRKSFSIFLSITVLSFVNIWEHIFRTLVRLMAQFVNNLRIIPKFASSQILLTMDLGPGDRQHKELFSFTLWIKFEHFYSTTFIERKYCSVPLPILPDSCITKDPGIDSMYYKLL